MLFSTVLSFLIRQFKHRKGQVLFIVLATIVTELVWSTAMPYATKQLIDALITAATTSPEVTRDLLFTCIKRIFELSVGAWIVNRFLQRTINRFQLRGMADLEQNSVRHMLGHSFQFFQDNFAGSLVRRVSRLSRAFEEIADNTQQRLIPILVAITGVLFVVFHRSSTIGLVVFTWIIFAITFNVLYSRWKMKNDLVRAAQDTRITGFLSDIISNVTTVKSFAQGKTEWKGFVHESETLRALRLKAWSAHDWSSAIQSLIMMCFQAGVMVYGVNAWARHEVSAGDLLLFQTYFFLLNNKMQDVTRMIRQYFSSFTDAKEMIDILNTPHAIQDAPKAKTLRVSKGEIDLQNVRFGYGDTAILRDFTLRIHAGERVAFIGPSGAGKSTVVKLLLRYHDVTSGSIRVDGQDIASVTQDSLRAAIALVPQEPVLFHRSIKDNIRYGRPNATEKEIIRAAKLARCHDFIRRLPEGYGTFVGERGVKLSGGERQRVAIARAILKNAPILVLDEATSSLDSESEKLIQDALHDLMKDRTVIVVAHRLSTIMEMDRILVLQNGAIIDQGTHTDLLAKKGLYHHLWNIQAGGFAEAS